MCLLKIVMCHRKVKIIMFQYSEAKHVTTTALILKGFFFLTKLVAFLV